MLTFVVTADESVSGVPREVPRVSEAKPVPGPLDDPDLVLHSAWQSHLTAQKYQNKAREVFYK